MKRIGALAKALNGDPVHLLRLALREYMPETWLAVEEIMGNALVTANELELIRAYRDSIGDRNSPARLVSRTPVIAIVEDREEV